MKKRIVLQKLQKRKISIQLNESKNYQDFCRALSNIERTYFKTMTDATTDSYIEALNYKKKEDRTRSVKVISRFGNFVVSAPTWINNNLAPNEHYLTSDLKQLVIKTVTSTSYDKGCAILNSALARKVDEELKATTIEHIISREGNLLRDKQLSCAQKIIEENNGAIPVPERRDLSGNSKSKKKVSSSEDNIKSEKNNELNNEDNNENGMNRENILIDDIDMTYETLNSSGDANNISGNELILKAIEFIKNHNTMNPELQISYNVINQLELNLEKINYIYFDYICVPHQNDKRCVNGNESSKISERVYHSNVCIKTPQGKYSITADNIQSAAYMSFAFLSKNELFNNHKLVFFTDGAKSIRDTIKDYFIPLKGVYHKTWLDWFYAKKKTNELLSLSLVNGGKKK